MDIGKGIGYVPLGRFESTIGALSVYSLSFGQLGKLFKELGRPIKDVEPYEFIRVLSIFTCYPDESVAEDGHKPNAAVLTRADVDSLNETDLEYIAKVVTESDSGLSKRPSVKKTPGTATPEQQETGLQKKLDETYVKYCQRLFINEEREWNEHIAKFTAPLGMFSEKLRKDIGASLVMGESLRNQISPIAAINIRPVIPALNKIDLERIERDRVKPIHELRERLDNILSMAEQAADTQAETHKVQVGIAGELKSSGDSANRYSKLNTRLSVFVLATTLMGLLVTVLLYFANQASGREDYAAYSCRADDIAILLKDMTAAIKNPPATSRDNEEIQRLKTMADLQRQQLQKLQVQKDHLEERVKSLEDPSVQR